MLRVLRKSLPVVLVACGLIFVASPAVSATNHARHRLDTVSSTITILAHSHSSGVAWCPDAQKPMKSGYGIPPGVIVVSSHAAHNGGSPTNRGWGIVARNTTTHTQRALVWVSCR